MKNKKLSKLAIVASAAMLLAGCNQNYAALMEYQKNAIQTKLEQMSQADADAYIRNEMNGVHMYHDEPVATMMATPNGGVMPAVINKRVEDGLYLDYWAEHDTNGTLIDEYVDYAMGNYAVEMGTKIEAKQAFKELQKQTKAQAAEPSK